MRQGMQREYMELKTDAPGIVTEWGFVSKFKVLGANAAAADTVSVLALTALTAAAQIVTAGISNPAATRNLQVVGSAVGMAGNVVVKGTAYDGKAITETFALNGTTTVVGTQAFKTITEVDLPVLTNAGDEVSVGVGDKLGLPFKLSLDTVLMAFLNGVKEGTLPTVTLDAANIENNTVTLNSALNGTDVEVMLIV